MSFITNRKRWACVNQADWAKTSTEMQKTGWNEWLTGDCFTCKNYCQEEGQETNAPTLMITSLSTC